jgi:hypothetical protein
VSLVLSSADRALLEKAASEGKPLACAVLGRSYAGSPEDGDIADQSIAWRAHYLAASRKGCLNLDRVVTPCLEICPACGLREYAEYLYGVGETASTTKGERNLLGHAGDEHIAWIVECLCLACEHEGELVIDTGEPLYR